VSGRGHARTDLWAATDGTVAIRRSHLTAARRAFSLTSSVTERDAVSGELRSVVGSCAGAPTLAAQTVNTQSGRDDQPRLHLDDADTNRIHHPAGRR
jgi:hypothetical protein